MAKYRCNVCGFIYDEEKEGKPFDQLTECPVCGQPTSAFTVYEVVAQSSPAEKKPEKLDYPREFSRTDERWRSGAKASQLQWGPRCPCRHGTIS